MGKYLSATCAVPREAEVLLFSMVGSKGGAVNGATATC